MPRYRKGMGKLTRRKKNGRMVSTWSFKFDGRWQSTGKTDKPEAESYRRQFLADVDKGKRSARASNLKMDALFDLVVADYERPRGKKEPRKSIGSLKSRLKQLRPAMGHMSPSKITTTFVEEIYGHGREERDGVADATIDREFEVIIRAFTLADEKGVFKNAPKIHKLNPDNRRQGFIDYRNGEYERLRESRAKPISLMYVIGFHIGWRAGKIKGLVWSDKTHLVTASTLRDCGTVDIDSGVIRQPARQAENKWVGNAPVYGDLRRELLIAKSLHDKDWADVPWVLHRAGSQIVDYRKAWAKGTAVAGFPDLLFHDLRRSAIRHMLDSGWERARIKRIIGHKTDSCFDGYVVESDEDVVRAGEHFGRHLQAVRGSRETTAEPVN